MKYAITIFLGLMTAGCWWTTPSGHMPMGASPLVVWGAGETISLISTGKTMEDHLFSVVTDKDCSIERAVKGEGKFCMTPVELERAARPKWGVQKIYCYQSLALPTCYDRPSPYPTDVLIGIYEKPIFPPNIYD